MERNLLIVISWKHVVSESSFNQRKQGQISIKHVEENGIAPLGLLMAKLNANIIFYACLSLRVRAKVKRQNKYFYLEFTIFLF